MCARTAACQCVHPFRCGASDASDLEHFTSTLSVEPGQPHGASGDAWPGSLAVHDIGGWEAGVRSPRGELRCPETDSVAWAVRGPGADGSRGGRDVSVQV